MNVPQPQNTSSWAPISSGSASQPPTSSSTPTATVAGTTNFATSTPTPTRVEPLTNIIASGVPLSSSSSLPLSSSSVTATGTSAVAGVITSAQQMGASSSSISGTPPSAGFKYPSVIIDDKKIRRTSLQVLPPKLPSSDSLSNSPGPASPGPTNWGDNHSTTTKFDGNSTEKVNSPDTTKLNRKESYKAQRKNYRREKKRVASELLNSLQDPAVIVLADWLKIRGTLKSWTKLWCVLKPGLLLLYKSPKTKSSHWVGTILLTSCQVIERPSKKDGFCFKLFHPLEQSIWAPRGPDKETIGAVVQPLPTSYLIFRAPSQAAGKCWMDALELSLRCSALLLRSNSNSGSGINTNEQITSTGTSISHETQWSEADYEKHFDDHEKSEKLVPNKPTFLCRYIPPTPPPIDRHITQLTSDQSASNSSINSLYPTPTPTPVFHQLFLAVSHLEKAMSRSPELIRQKYQDIKNSANGGGAGNYGSVGVGGVGGGGGGSGVVSGNGVRNNDCNRGFSRFKRNGGVGLNVKRSASRDDNFSGTSTPDFSPTASPIKRAISFTALPCATDTDDGTPTLRRKSTPSSLVHQKRIYKTRSNIKLKSNDLDADSQNEGAAAIMSGLETESESDVPDNQEPEDINEETPYVHLPEEEFGAAGEQVAELPEEQKSLIWFLVKQVRPGMDLSKVVLPTFILEPRSFLDKLSDSYYHADILSKAVVEDDPFTRMKTVVQWYMSGFYKKPKGLKKPYNPILGETFRCYWEHLNGSRTFYIAEQVSHHPPVSAFYVTNRQDGFCISCTILAKSKFYGNSTSAILDGVATLTLLPRGESYTLTVPYAHCKGILMGTLSMELGGKVSIECENTGYKADIEFKLKPFLGGSEYTNLVTGRLKLGKETLATINGHWDGEIRMKDSRTGEETILFSATPDVRAKRLKRYVVPIESQANNESERLWQHVSAAIRRDDQIAATEEKTALEEAQRAAAKERKATLSEWEPAHFQQDLVTGKWVYKYADLRPWDPRNDLKQFECNYRIQTKTRHQAPMVRTASIVSTEPITILKTDSRSSLVALKQQQQQSKRKMNPKRVSQESTPEHGEQNSDSSQSNENIATGGGGVSGITGHSGGITAYAKNKKLMETLEKINRTLEEHSRRLTNINLNLERISFAPIHRTDHKTIFHKLHLKTIGYILLGIVLSVIVRYILKV